MSQGKGLSIHDLAQRAGCRRIVVERFFQLGVIEEIEMRGGEPYFRELVVDRVQRALRIRRDLRIGSASLGLVLDLLDRIEQLENELEQRD